MILEWLHWIAGRVRIGVAGKRWPRSLIAGLTVGVAAASAAQADLSAGGSTGKLIARDILVVTGIEVGKGEPQWPADTATAKRIQMPLEWMGYELRYRGAADIARLGFPALGEGVAGVVLDGNIRLPVEQERQFVNWIAAAKTAKKKILLIDAIPVRDYIESRRLVRLLGMSGSMKNLRRPTSVEIASLDEALMNSEVEVKPLLVPLADLHAPAGAHVGVSVRASGGGRHVRFDPVFTTTWGGALLHPYAILQASDVSVLSYVDIFAFLGEIWPAGTFPAPDPTTRDGLRAFLIHIDGDGFTTLSHLKRGETSGKIIIDQFLKKYPFPVTASVIEADIRALQVGLRDEDRALFEQQAREMFALPHVEAASHTFSHPFIWIDSDQESYAGSYESRMLKLKPGNEYPEIIYEREIGGSIDYIESNLLPADKRVRVLLWSGNCRPPPAALKLVRERGIVSLNGGDTIISKRYPGIAGVAPRVMYWGDELQIFAPNQNDFSYTNDWEGPIYSGFSQAIETFDMTESPRRLKPVNIYYHFYSGTMLSSLLALHKVHRWCAAQPLHAITASSYARIARDSHLTKIFTAGPRRWRIENAGHLRTFRIPRSLGSPDLHLSNGVTGYNDHGEWRYVHTDGGARTEIVLADEPQPHLYLASSSAEIRLTEFAIDRLAFEATGDLRPIQVVLGGAPSGSACSVEINGAEKQLTADPLGRLAFEMPERVVASVRVGALAANATAPLSE